MHEVKLGLKGAEATRLMITWKLMLNKHENDGVGLWWSDVEIPSRKIFVWPNDRMHGTRGDRRLNEKKRWNLIARPSTACRDKPPSLTPCQSTAPSASHTHTHTHTHKRPFSISANKVSRLSPEMFALDEALALALSLIESSFFSMKRTADPRHSKCTSRHFALTRVQQLVWWLSGIPQTHTGSAWNTVRSCSHILRHLQWALTFGHPSAWQHVLTYRQRDIV
jgi:hypothetical protein